MKNIKCFLVFLALPFFLIHIKIEHSKLESEKKRKMYGKVYKNHHLRAVLKRSLTKINQKEHYEIY